MWRLRQVRTFLRSARHKLRGQKLPVLRENLVTVDIIDLLQPHAPLSHLLRVTLSSILSINATLSGQCNWRDTIREWALHPQVGIIGTDNRLNPRSQAPLLTKSSL